VPKVVDHEQRRRVVAKAVCDQVAADGIHTVTVRAVAARAGVSVGLVQHYFTDKNDLLEAAMAYVQDSATERIERRLAQVPDGQSPWTIVSTIAHAMLPSDDAQLQELQVGIAFHSHALVVERLADYLRVGYARLRALLSTLIAQIADASDPDLEADMVLAVVDGVSDAIAIGRVTMEEGHRLLDAHLAHTLARLSQPPPSPGEK
jgi:AcrR family transcriptional regulator